AIFGRPARESGEAAANGLGYYPPALGLVVRSGEDGRPLYARPSYAANDRAFYDLVAYAPGLNTSSADLLSVLDAEARPDPRAKPGKIDAKAKALIDSLRKPAWRKYSIPAQGLAPAYDVVFDGAGKFAWERTLASGLKEKVVCDGKTLYHL